MGIKEEKTKKFSWPIYRRLLAYATKQWPLFTVSILTLLVTSFMTSTLPLLIGMMLDLITNAQSEEVPALTDKYYTFALLLGALSVGTWIRIIVVEVLQERIAINIRTDVFSKFLYNDIHFFEKYKTGDLNSRLGNDINQAKSAASNNITFMMRNFLTICANIVILMWMSWELSLIVLLIVPLYVLSTIIHNKSAKVLVREYQNVTAETSSVVNEVFSGIQMVKAYGGEEKEIANYSEIQAKGYAISFKRSIFSGLYFTASVLLPNVGVLLVLWYGGSLVINKKSNLSAGELTSFIMYCTTISNNVNALSNSYSNIITGTSAIQKVFEMLEYEPTVAERSSDLFPDRVLQGEIQFSNVGFRYPKSEVMVLQNLDLRIKPGEYVAFVGESGSGKSTIVKLIERFYEVQFGEIYYDGIPARQLSIRNIREQIGFVGQEPVLFSGSIEDNITYGVKDYSYDELIAICKQSGVFDFISNETLFPEGLKSAVGERGSLLSGGQKQRVSIARALMRKPKILIFDEATSALDSNSEYLVQKSIENLVSQNNGSLTVIVIAHRLSTVINAHRIVLMKSGKIAEQGRHEELLEKGGYYSELFDKQIQTQGVRSSKSIESPVRDSTVESES